VGITDVAGAAGDVFEFGTDVESFWIQQERVAAQALAGQVDGTAWVDIPHPHVISSAALFETPT